jgi:hypothetical protein
MMEAAQPDGAEYRGIAMPLWLSLTADGVGFHVGGFKRGRCTSHGCIRCPEKPQPPCWDWAGPACEGASIARRIPPTRDCEKWVGSQSLTKHPV